jgi:tRNA A64-2'-O-ribosylphosphate transferase
MPQPTVQDLIFPSQSTNFSRLLTDLKRSNLSISNRLRSIHTDSLFVVRLASLLSLPLVANERCGSWYIPPHLKASSAYFKSTDGHAGQWSFSTRRLNLHLLELIAGHGGCVIVDSTRRGKRMPDALSKTVPIWCCVMNRVLFPDGPPDWHGLYVPAGAVGESERSQIEARIGGFVEAFWELRIDVEPLREKVRKPLRPVWRTGDDELLEGDDVDGGRERGFYPVVCCTSSRRVVGAEMSEGGYIQGAGDDTENWACRLTAQMFWENVDELLGAPEGELPGIIGRLVKEQGEKCAGGGLRRVTDGLYVSALPVEESDYSLTCLIKLVSGTTEKETWLRSKSEMEIGIGKSKTAGRNLRHALPTICEFVKKFLDSNTTTSEEATKYRVVVACETGKDLSVGVALALDCWCFDEDGRLRKDVETPSFTKTAIRVRLGRIMTAMPDANPSRTILQSVNSFLMDWTK